MAGDQRGLGELVVVELERLEVASGVNDADDLQYVTTVTKGR